MAKNKRIANNNPINPTNFPKKKSKHTEHWYTHSFFDKYTMEKASTSITKNKRIANNITIIPTNFPKKSKHIERWHTHDFFDKYTMERPQQSRRKEQILNTPIDTKERLKSCRESPEGKAVLRAGDGNHRVDENLKKALVQTGSKRKEQTLNTPIDTKEILQSCIKSPKGKAVLLSAYGNHKVDENLKKAPDQIGKNEQREKDKSEAVLLVLLDKKGRAARGEGRNRPK